MWLSLTNWALSSSKKLYMFVCLFTTGKPEGQGIFIGKVYFPCLCLCRRPGRRLWYSDWCSRYHWLGSCMKVTDHNVATILKEFLTFWNKQFFYYRYQSTTWQPSWRSFWGTCQNLSCQGRSTTPYWLYRVSHVRCTLYTLLHTVLHTVLFTVKYTVHCTLYRV